ncbi:LON peptidase substrate-binding domain-containing protein [Ignavibacterium sp.]|uniref:LON peptidase substrate-binding domain-containing protein n=1 Tax=Ignavibacterium sp. TaxID=2651167 RepID=UPI00307D52A3
MSLKIPIIPLQLVVFPGSKYPLHIFEPRYKTLIKESLENNTGFGIVLIFENKISDVCTYAKVSLVVKQYMTGESDIVVEGIRRYLINNVQLHPVGYLVADVESYDDETEIVDHNLEIQLIILFEELLARIDYTLPEEFWINLRESSKKSFKIAEKAGLSLLQQQELLILRNENSRLKFLIEHLNNLERNFNSEATLKTLIMQDGFINEKKDSH